MYQFELRPHPARVRVHGKMVPLISDILSIYVLNEEDGKHYLCGYCGKKSGMPITLIRQEPESFCDEVEAFVREQIGDVLQVCQPAMVIEDDND